MLGETAYQNALKRRDRIQREMEQFRREAEQIEKFLQLCEHFASMTEESIAPALSVSELAIPTQGAEERPTRRRLTRSVSGLALLPHIRKVMLEIGKPLRRSEIMRALEARGIRVGGDKPMQNLGSIMWRAKTERREFENFDKLGYWPADVAYLPAGYDPSSNDHDETEDENAPKCQERDLGSEPSEVWEQAARGA